MLTSAEYELLDEARECRGMTLAPLAVHTEHWKAGKTLLLRGYFRRVNYGPIACYVLTVRGWRALHTFER
jgi:hypothetical protein